MAGRAGEVNHFLPIPTDLSAAIEWEEAPKAEYDWVKHPPNRGPMALIQCPECAATISSRAAACPHCGFPLARRTAGADVYERGGFPDAPGRTFGQSLAEFLIALGVLILMALLCAGLAW
jgi:hypothetical protein